MDNNDASDESFDPMKEIRKAELQEAKLYKTHSQVQ